MLKDGIGVVLMQDNHPLAFIRTLGPKWQKLSVYEEKIATYGVCSAEVGTIPSGHPFCDSY